MVTRARRNSEAALGRRILSRRKSRPLAGPSVGLAAVFPVRRRDPRERAVRGLQPDARRAEPGDRQGRSQRRIVSEGWWTIGANRCVDVIKEELANKYVYVYATDVFGQPILAGDFTGYDMCVAPKKLHDRGHRLLLAARLPDGALHRGGHQGAGALDAVPEGAGLRLRHASRTNRPCRRPVQATGCVQADA